MNRPLAVRILFLSVLAEALWTSGGNYDAPHIALVSTLLAALVPALLRGVPAVGSPRALHVALALPTALAFALLVYDTSLSPSGSSGAFLAVRALVALGAVLFSTALAFMVRRAASTGAASALVLAALGCMIAARALVPSVCPEPHIDVFTTDTEAADYVLRGQNPYTGVYTDIYGRTDARPVFAYLPGALLWLAPARALFHDIRFGILAADAVTGLSLYLAARRLCPGRDGGARLTSLLFSASWVASPIGLYVVQKSWVDLLLTATCALSFLALGRGRFGLAGVLLGLAVATKQYGALVLVFTVLWMMRYVAWRKTALLCGVAVGVAALLVVPFAAASFADFHRSTIAFHAATAFRDDSFSIPAFLVRTLHLPADGIVADITKVVPPLAVLISAVALLLARGAPTIIGRVTAAEAEPRSARRPDARPLYAALFCAFGVAFLFSKQSFCNYYQFASLFLFFELIEALQSKPAAGAR